MIDHGALTVTWWRLLVYLVVAMGLAVGGAALITTLRLRPIRQQLRDLEAAQQEQSGLLVLYAGHVRRMADVLDLQHLVLGLDDPELIAEFDKEFNALQERWNEKIRERRRNGIDRRHRVRADADRG